MKSKNFTWLLAACSTFCLANCSAISIPNLRAVTPINPALGIGAIYTETNSKVEGELTSKEFIEFLYAQKDKNGGAAKGPASCFSSEDTEKIITTLESICVKVSCDYEEFSEVVKKIQGARFKAVELAPSVKKAKAPAKLR